jgi:CRISPR-associated protein Cas1
VDKAIIEALKRNLFKKGHFLRTDDYIIRIRPDAVKKLLNEIDKQFSVQVKCGSRQEQWGNIIGIKAQELSNYLVEKRKTLDLASPSSSIDRVDSADLRQKIMNMTFRQWRDLGYITGTLHQLKKKVEENKPFTLNQHVKSRLDTL